MQKLEYDLGGLKTIFQHYGLAAGSNDFIRVVRNPGSCDLDSMFSEHNGNIIFFGHDHFPTDIQGTARYINPGSLGCCSNAIARYAIAEYSDGSVDIQQRSVAYDDKELFRAFEERDVPEREIIYKVFFVGRFG